jgi:hypothetical protein
VVVEATKAEISKTKSAVAIVCDTHTTTRLIKVQSSPRRIVALKLDDMIFDALDTMKQ